MKRFIVLSIVSFLLSGFAHSQLPETEQEIQVQSGLMFNPGDRTFIYGGHVAGFNQSATTLVPGISYAYHNKLGGIEASMAYRQINFNTVYRVPKDTVITNPPLAMHAFSHYLRLQGTGFLRICHAENCDLRIGGGMGLNILMAENFALVSSTGDVFDEDDGDIFRRIIAYSHLQVSYRKYFMQQFFFDARGMMQFNINDMLLSWLYKSPISKQQFSLQLGVGMRLLPKTSSK